MQISVIIPTFQPQDYLWQCLDALRQQTLPYNQWEVILILNGPKEPYLSAIQEYINTSLGSNIRLLYTDQAGVSHARNMGLDNAQGEYITFIDDDDYVSPTFLEELLSQATPQIVSLCNVQAFSDDNPHLPNYFEDAYLLHAHDGLQPFYKARQYFSSSCLKLIHRDIIGTRRFNPNFRNGEDSLFMFLISDKLTHVQFTSPAAVYFRRVRTNSASTKVSKWKQIKNCLNIMLEYTTIYCHGNYARPFYRTRMLGAIHTILTR